MTEQENSQFIRRCAAWEKETQATLGVLSREHMIQLAMETCALIFNHPDTHKSNLVTTDHWRRWFVSVEKSAAWSPDDHPTQQICEAELRAALLHAPFDSSRHRLRSAIGRFTCVNALRMDLYMARIETAVR